MTAYDEATMRRSINDFLREKRKARRPFEAQEGQPEDAAGMWELKYDTFYREGGFEKKGKAA
jgi:hypothetical protein